MAMRVAAVLCAMVAATQAAADAGRGEALYRQHCATCHGGGQSTAGEAIRAGAGRPDILRNAVATIGAMTIFEPVLRAGDYDDLAAYLAQRYGVAPPATFATTTAVEFHHAGLDHYFVSAIADEIAALDDGTRVRGWARTGSGFPVWPAPTAAPAGAAPVCRFYLPPAWGDSHFLSASPAECAEVAARFPQFTFESAQVMAVLAADGATGACPAGASQVYRLWNRRPDTNHRYAVDPALRQRMIDAGWIAEGHGPLGVAFCAPAGATIGR